MIFSHVASPVQPAAQRPAFALASLGRRVLALAALLVAALPAVAANYPLELVTPRPVNTSPVSGAAAITAGNRIFKAYPGIEYNIRAYVVGGTYPYTYALSGAPSGMTINTATGEIRWPNPTGTSVTPTVSVTDSEGTQRTSQWTINVTTAGFKFIDAVNGSSTGTGAINSPWRRISDMVNSSSAVLGDIVYFRTGTYDALDLPRVGVGSGWDRVEINSSKPNMWIAYPGESPVINFGFNPGVETGVIIRFNHTNMYIDGFETRNSRIIGFQVVRGSYGVFRRLRMRDHNVIRANLDGSNASFINTLTGQGTFGQYLTIEDCDFSNALSDMAIKIYSQEKLLIQNNVFRDMMWAVELKAEMPQLTYRQNTHFNIGAAAIGGNMHNDTTYGEILYNLVSNAPGEAALVLNQDGMARRIDVYRNTFVGRVQVRNTDSADGPFRFYNNVIVNSDDGTPAGTHIHQDGVSDVSRVTNMENLVGYPSANIVDASGNLTAQYAQYVGSRGHQVGIAPYPPGNVSAR